MSAASSSTATARPELQQLADRVRPTVLAREQVLPVLPALRDLVPGGALARGSIVGVTGAAATSVALALAAGPSAQGSWVAVVGVPTLGLAAAAELGLALERLVLVREPSPSSWGPVVAALVGSFDVIVLASPSRVRAADARRLAARTRERGSVLVHLGGGAGLEHDVHLTTGGVRWDGLERGHGHLRARRVTVEAGGRRRASRPRRMELWLVDERGQVRASSPSSAQAAPVPGEPGHATVTDLRRRRAG